MFHDGQLPQVKWLLFFGAIVLLAGSLIVGNWILALASGALALAVYRTLSSDQRQDLRAAADWKWLAVAVVLLAATTLATTLFTTSDRIRVLVFGATFSILVLVMLLGSRRARG